MPSKTDKTAGEVDWPPQFERTPTAERKRTSKFSLTFHQALKRLENELLERVDADDVRVSTAAPHRKRDGRPYADSNPDDPAVVARWTKDGDQYAVASDHYTDWRDNCRAIGLYIQEKRKMSDRPVKTGQDEFATARLPSGDEEEAIAVEPESGDTRAAHEVLDVSPDATEAVVKGAARQLMAQHKPNGNDGDREEFVRVQKAKEAMLNE